ncbi:MAG: Asp23/Gls24 family envelope stress response protein [Atopobiaceae bacterium]|nr:Asp23/Gls24 family envelope stress response protein [Atopobiaceae bacterium]
MASDNETKVGMEVEQESMDSIETPEDELSYDPSMVGDEGDESPYGEIEDDSEDSLTFSNGVIEKIVALAVRNVPGVIGMKGRFINRVQETLGGSNVRKGVSVEVMPDGRIHVNIAVLIEYGAYAPQVFEDVKQAVVEEVTGLTGLEVSGVNLRIEDVLTPEEIQAHEPEPEAHLALMEEDEPWEEDDAEDE